MASPLLPERSRIGFLQPSFFTILVLLDELMNPLELFPKWKRNSLNSANTRINN